MSDIKKIILALLVILITGVLFFNFNQIDFNQIENYLYNELELKNWHYLLLMFFIHTSGWGK